MSIITSLAPEKESLPDFTAGERKNPVIDWYRTPIPKEELKALHNRSDLLGAIQTLGYLGILGLMGGLAVYSSMYGPLWATLVLTYGYGMVLSFAINGVHELGHGTVFKTKWLNVFFCHVLAFLGWINHEMFQTSHTRHHRYTLHPPDDLEVVLPIRLMLKHFLLNSFIHFRAIWGGLKDPARIACGRFKGDWELTLYPESEPEKRAVPIRWARILLGGHALIAVAGFYFGLWIVPVLFVLPPFYGGWLFFLCNNTQHVGMLDNVPDFRLSCRTFTLNPVFRFLYWQMNYHTEHHMYAAVPCYHLDKLHRLIRHDLPYCPNGLVEVWREIADIQGKQEKDPTCQHTPVFPPTAAPARFE